MTRGLLGIVALVVGLGACSDDDAPAAPSPRVLTTISTLPVDAIEVGQSIHRDRSGAGSGRHRSRRPVTLDLRQARDFASMQPRQALFGQ
jgi:hypothetical protein